MKNNQVTEQSIQEQIRWMVAQSIHAGAVLDVALSAEIVARAHGLTTSQHEIAAELAEAGLAARVPMKLPGRHSSAL